MGALGHAFAPTFGLGLSYRALSVLDLVAEAYGQMYFGNFSFPAALPFEAVVGAKIFVDRNSYLTLVALMESKKNSITYHEAV